MCSAIPAEYSGIHYLYTHPAIQEVAVFDKPHAQKGETVAAAVILKEGAAASGEEIIAYCRDRIAAYKAPSRVDIVSELPKSATGKILKRVLRG